MEPTTVKTIAGFSPAIAAYATTLASSESLEPLHRLIEQGAFGIIAVIFYMMWRKSDEVGKNEREQSRLREESMAKENAEKIDLLNKKHYELIEATNESKKRAYEERDEAKLEAALAKTQCANCIGNQVRLKELHKQVE